MYYVEKSNYQIGVGKYHLNDTDHRKKNHNCEIHILFVSSLYFTLPRLGVGDIFLLLPSSVCILTHSSLPWSPWSLGLAWGFEVVVKARGHEDGRGVIMRSSPRLLLPNLPSSPFVLLPFHVHATHLFSSTRITASSLRPLLLLAYQSSSSLFSFPTSSSLFPPLNLCDSQSVPPFLPPLSSPGGPLNPGPPLSLLLPAQPGPQSMGGRQPDSLRAAGSCSSRG